MFFHLDCLHLFSVQMHETELPGVWVLADNVNQALRLYGTIKAGTRGIQFTSQLLRKGHVCPTHPPVKFHLKLTCQLFSFSRFLRCNHDRCFMFTATKQKIPADSMLTPKDDWNENSIGSILAT